MQSQCKRLLKYLETHKTIDPMTAWKELGIYRTSARMLDLRRAGNNITSSVKRVKNRYGEVCRVALYRLEA